MNWKLRLEGFLTHPLMGGVITVGTLISGALAACFPTEIVENHWVWPLITWRHISWAATSFAGSAIVVGTLFSAAQWAQLSSSNRARQELGDYAAKLQGSISRLESLPPRKFLVSFQEQVRRAVFSATIGMGDRNHVEAAIRNVLGALLELSKNYDCENNNAVYAANIMIFRVQCITVNKNPASYIPHSPHHPDFEGCLELMPMLSTTSASLGFVPDVEMQPFAIPIPKKKDVVPDAELKSRHPVLPGAPWAFHYREFAGFPSINELDSWLTTKSTAGIEIVEGVRQHFRAGLGKNIKSFASMPLLHPSSEEGLPIGVLNLHSNFEGLLAVKGGERFSPLAEPLRALLSVLVLQYMASSKD